MKLKDSDVAKVIFNELFTEDCYRLDEIPDGCVVLDVGSLYGEFGLHCHLNKGCAVVCYEPSKENFATLMENVGLNPEIAPQNFVAKNVAVAGTNGQREFLFRADHPAGSLLKDVVDTSTLASKTETVECVTLGSEIALAKAKWPGKLICVKLDCEAAETEIFSDESWFEDVYIVTMEWHNHDGHVYADKLRDNRFAVWLEGGGPKPRPKYNKSIGGGLLFAKRRQR